VKTTNATGNGHGTTGITKPTRPGNGTTTLWQNEPASTREPNVNGTNKIGTKMLKHIHNMENDREQRSLNPEARQPTTDRNQYQRNQRENAANTNQSTDESKQLHGKKPMGNK
jgi:hypothetical protein